MDNYIIMVDSACDLPLNLIKEYELYLIGLKCNFKDKEYVEDENMPLSYSEFYNGIREGEMPTTSQINTYTFYENFKKHVKEGKSIIYPAFSSGLSGTINSAELAKKDILEDYPNADITIINTKCASLGYGLLVSKACLLKKDGASKDDIVEYINYTFPKVHHLVLMDDLDYLKRGGRLSGTAASLGSILQLKPLIKMNSEGKLINYSKVKGRKRGIATLFKEFEENVLDINSQKVIAISHSDCIEDAEKLAGMIKEKYDIEIIINYIGCAIGSHTGVGTIALFFLGENR